MSGEIIPDLATDVVLDIFPAYMLRHSIELMEQSGYEMRGDHIIALEKFIIGRVNALDMFTGERVVSILLETFTKALREASAIEVAPELVAAVALLCVQLSGSSEAREAWMDSSLVASSIVLDATETDHAHEWGNQKNIEKAASQIFKSLRESGYFKGVNTSFSLYKG